MAQKKHLDDFLRGRIIRRLECGRTQLEVSEELGIAQSVISRLWQRFQDDGNVSRCYSTGRPRVTTPNEDRFSLQSDSHRTLIWRVPGTRYPQENTIERHRYDGSGWLVWGEIILGSKTELHVQSVTMTGRLFMDDNARPHRANIVDKCLHLSYGSILTGLESNRACVGYAWPTNCSPSIPSHLSTGTLEGIA
ncbi:transposable element Tcb1 transposase [Trichonephila clavipes]|nr:transposable element Tcb1 transposase [Trichonephila clavipes]